MAKIRSSATFPTSSLFPILLLAIVGCKALPDFNNPLDPNRNAAVRSYTTIYYDPMESLSQWKVTQVSQQWIVWSAGNVGKCIGALIVSQASPVTVAIEKDITTTADGIISLWIYKFYDSDVVNIYLDSSLKYTRTGITHAAQNPVDPGWEEIYFSFPKGTHSLRIEVNGRSANTDFDELRIQN